MFDPGLLIAFAWVTALTSIVPGPSMLFVMGQAIWRGTQSGWSALLGMQIGYILWWIAAGLGLGTLAAAYPNAFRLLAIGGILYLAWLGLMAIRHSLQPGEEDETRPVRPASSHAFRDGIAVAVGNPKSLVYVVAILPPFIDADRPVGSQIVVLAIVAMVIDLLVGWLYIAAGKRVAKLMERAATRRWIDRTIGLIFILIAAVIAIDLHGTHL